MGWDGHLDFETTSLKGSLQGLEKLVSGWEVIVNQAGLRLNYLEKYASNGLKPSTSPGMGDVLFPLRHDWSVLYIRF